MGCMQCFRPSMRWALTALRTHRTAHLYPSSRPVARQQGLTLQDVSCQMHLHDLALALTCTGARGPSRAANTANNSTNSASGVGMLICIAIIPTTKATILRP
ncbi:hypothetical protein Vafri_7611 [Volvox africanus]|uniref:Uncharacterized protein n=1 Tax=Volvox africanus TaxID=51714 RepID=A0A8J4B0T8_9CHLO|nr:hypothetical protein Vafri_7611 [Volvox africanus]